MKGGNPLRNINKILIQRLRKYNFQNFSQLLNTPEPEPTYFSYFESIANLIYDTVYDDESTLESEINKDLDKFSEDCITIEDSSKNIKYKKTNDSTTPQIENNNTKTNLKLLLDDPIDNYINKIAVKYSRFCTNHTEIKKIQNQNKINNINNINNNISLNNRYNFYIKIGKTNGNEKQKNKLLESIEKLEKKGYELMANERNILMGAVAVNLGRRLGWQGEDVAAFAETLKAIVEVTAKSM